MYKNKATTLVRYIYSLHKKIINNFNEVVNFANIREMYENIRANVFVENISPCITKDMLDRGLI